LFLGDPKKLFVQFKPHMPEAHPPPKFWELLSEVDVPLIAMTGADICFFALVEPHLGHKMSSVFSRTLWKTSYVELQSVQ
jgi:hypothetical protein